MATATTHKPRVDDRDWTKLSFGEQVKMLEVEGYLVLPNVLTEEQLEVLRAEAAEIHTKGADYSERQRTAGGIAFIGGAITRLVANPPTIAFLERLFGDDLIAMSYAYARSEPGHPGISLHTDGQPWGSQIFGYEGSVPVLVRVLNYLEDLTLEVSPFRVVPRSHLSMHSDGNPYLRYESHPDEVMVPVKAGSAVLINHRVFHGNFPNTGEYAREMLAIAYRPAWGGPVQDVEQWPEDEVAKLPEDLRRFYGDKNIHKGDFHGGNKPAGMKSEAPGIDFDRWDNWV